MIWDNLKQDLIFIDLDVDDREDVFKTVGGKLTELGDTKDTYVGALGEREKVFPTGLDVGGIGVAIPHTDQVHVNKTALAVAKLKHPVMFHQMATNPKDNVMVPVTFIIMLAVNGSNYMEFLQHVIMLIQDQDVLKKLVNATNAKEIIETIKKKEETL